MAGKSKAGGVEALQKASEGLLYQSETDAPLEAFEWPGEEGKPDKARVLELAGLPPDTPVKTKSLDAFFKDATQEQDWPDDQEKAEVPAARAGAEGVGGGCQGIPGRQGRERCVHR